MTGLREDLRTIAIIDLSAAVLCPDCNAISNGVHQCPRCTNRNLQALGPVLDRTIGQVEESK